MPKTNKSGKPITDELPSTLQRSGRKAQETFAKTYDSAMGSYDDEGRAARTAMASLKHTHEKVGDHWEPKAKKGPSDAQAAKKGTAARRGTARTAEGVDANASKTHLMELARKLDIPGRSSMRKDELVEAIKKANRRETRKRSS